MKQPLRYFQVLLFFLSVVFATNAQIACFTVSSTKGCVPFTVTVDASCASSPGTSPFYNYDYLNDPLNFTTATTFIYPKAGTYTIRQIVTSGSIFFDVIVVAVDPTPPQFTLTSCSGRFVSTIISDPTYDNFIVDFGDGTPTTTVSDGSTVNHVYTAEGTKSVTVTGVFGLSQICKSITKTVYAINGVIKPDLIDLKVLQQRTANGSTQLRFNSITGQKYRIERSTNGGAFTTVSATTLAGNNAVITYTDTDPILNTQGNNYQYRIVSFDDCGTERISDVISTVRINATANNAVNNVNWNTSLPVSSYELKKGGAPQSLASPTATTYADNAITCGIQYCYQSIASLPTLTLSSGLAQQSYSIDTCIVAKNVPASPPVAVTNLNSTMNGNTATISWNAPAGGTSSTTLYQSVNGGAYSVLSKPSTNSFTYPISNTSSTYCFQVDYKDLCNNQSLKSRSTCPVLINGTVTGTSVSLHWNAYTGFDGTGVQSYVVQKLNETGAVVSETTVGSGTTFSETVDLTNPYLNYRIKVIPTNNTHQPVFSNNIIFTFEAQVFVPNIFTPNGDGVNEVFEVKAKYITSYSITIFSRWGEVVYASNSVNESWDGIDRNVLAVEGAYTYKIIATNVHNKEFIQTGTVTLTR